jgi:DnaJ like chaperone protein
MSVWGKVIGGAAGFVLGGPLGAMMGVMAGNIYDKKRKISTAQQEIPNQQKQFQKISNQEKQHIFALSVITLTAKLAKADGAVTQDEIKVFKEKFKIPPDEEEQVRNIFNEAQKTVYGFESIAQQVGELFHDSHEVLEEILNNLFYVAEADGKISESELSFLKTVSSIFKFDENTFQRIYQAQLNDKESDPYKVLGVKRTDNEETIKKNWIKLSKEHHPDNLVAKGMPPEFIEQATKEIASINKAYDKINKERDVN